MDSKKKILSYKLFLQQEYSNFHLPYNSEMKFYDAVGKGDFDEVKKYMNPLTQQGLGKLSSNPLRNIRYHLIITIAMITRFCIEGGMPSEEAYTLSDIYIQQIDRCNDFDEINTIHREVIYDFTDRMSKIRKNIGFSKTIIKTSEYIYNHLTEKINLDDICQELNINKSYLCELFKKETGITILQYTQKLKIEAAKKMLIYTDYSSTDISNYFNFASHSHFISIFKKFTGMTPKEYQKQNYQHFFQSKLDDFKNENSVE